VNEGGPPLKSCPTLSKEPRPSLPINSFDRRWQRQE
jgi:hypothetical protein